MQGLRNRIRYPFMDKYYVFITIIFTDKWMDCVADFDWLRIMYQFIFM